MLTIAVDIDGTIRDLESSILKWFEEDYPDKFEQFNENRGKTYQSLNPIIGEEEATKWLYVDRPFELFAGAPRLNRSIIEDLNKFSKAMEKHGHRVVIASVQKEKSIVATMYWLSKMGCKLKEYIFFDSMQEKIDANFDIYIDDCPAVLEAFVDQTTDYDICHPTLKLPRAIKITYEFNKHIECPELDVANGKFNDIYDILKIEREF